MIVTDNNLTDNIVVDDITYPIAEIYNSLQGEGTWVGTPMLFVRLAGCPVGKYEPPTAQQSLETDPGSLHVLRASHPAHSICTAWNGTRFLCDTDYHVQARMRIDEILGEL